MAHVIGRYELHGQIASGGMAVVHFGRLRGSAGFSRPVAIKRLHARLSRDETARRMFVDEARLASRIAHPNVVPTLDVVEDGGELLLVLEYVHGESLQQLMRAMRERGELLPVRIALGVMTAVLHGLHAAHEASGEDGEPLCIVHRDVSPQNVLVGADGVARVLDFGIARAHVRLESTSEGVVKGKLAYMAPEQLGGAPLDRRADIYAASVVLWELLAGRRLFMQEDGANVMIDRLLRGDVEPPSRHRPSVPKLLDAIVLNALARNPERRFATAREMALALERLGEVARPSEIGEWLESLAGEVLAKRRAYIRSLEATDDDDDPPVIDLVVRSGDTLSSGTPRRLALAPPNEQPSSLSPPHAVSVTLAAVPARRRPSAALVAAAHAFVGAAVVFGAMALAWTLGAGGQGASTPAAPAPVATAATRPAVPPPSACPSGSASGAPGCKGVPSAAARDPSHP
jgi:serine/threonine-protein kinase